jgi:hypothetical protein
MNEGKMSHHSRFFAGVLLITVPTIAYGGSALLRQIAARTPGYLDNPVRQDLFRAGHAHAGVLVLLALVGLLYVDATSLSEPFKWLARLGLGAAPILMPLGFFLSVASPHSQSPNALLWLVWLGAACLCVGALTLGIGLVRS